MTLWFTERGDAPIIEGASRMVTEMVEWPSHFRA